ncbi:MAG: glycosyltransferase [Candidatus Pacearchaeota archaeon]|nr:glycosyltransferase [Candidatus Pacearchaeota archaeon]
MRQKISVISVVHNEEKLIRRCLDSVKDIADEILILHDGPCSDKTLKIAKKYTNNVFQTEKNAGVPGIILPILFRKVKFPWVLKIDADEFLSPEFKKNIRKLVQNPKADAYIVKWPFWDGKKHITKNWPTKMPLYRKSKMSYFGFPHWDDPKINGNIIMTDFLLEHQPSKGAIPTWKEFKEKTLGRYARLHAEYTLKEFKDFDRFQHNKKDFPVHIKIRRKFPLLSALPFAMLAFVKTLFSEGAWKEGYPAFNEAAQSLVYYPYLGYLVFQLKRKKIKPIYATLEPD